MNEVKPRKFHKRPLSAFVLFVVFLISYVPRAQGAITFISASGASTIDTTGSPPVIYAGTAGLSTDCAATDNSDGTCNNCPTTANVFRACNPARVKGSTDLTFTFISDTATGYPNITGSLTSSAYIKGTTSVAAKTNASITINWGFLCGKIEAGSDCTTSKSATIRIGIDANSDGLFEDPSDDHMVITVIVETGPSNDTSDTADTHVGPYSFKVWPGDGKVYLPAADMTAGTSFPNGASGIKYKNILAFYATGTTTFDSAGWDAINVAGMAGTHAPLAISENNSTFLTLPDTVGGLANDVYYYFRLAVEDLAGNVGYFTTDLDTEGVHATQPSRVVGLLNEDLNCFIATAAYGSPFTTPVADLRRFRDVYLKNSLWGKSFINWYYSYGPYAAHWISKNETLRTLSRGLLIPVWGFAKLSLLTSLEVATTLTAMLFSLCFVALVGIGERLFRQREVL
jgi:hypothetical protein